MSVASVLGRPLRARTWRELLYLLLGLPAGIAAFTVFVTGVSTGLGLLVTFVGIPILVATAYADRVLAWVERQRAELVLGEPIAQAYRLPGRPGVLPLLRALVTDPQTYKDAAWMVIVFVVGVASAVIAIVVWSTAFAAVTLPFYAWAISAEAVSIDLGGSEWTAKDWEGNRWWVVALGTLAGCLLVVAAAWVCAGLAQGQARLARFVLSPGAGEARVSELTETRAATVQAQASELRRIERDLHDGAQARLVAVTLDLGLAKQKLDTDPAAARELIEAAHAETREAIAELRRLVSGIAPAVLADRGLDAALSGLVASCRVPVSLDVHLPRPLPEAVEVAAYFVASESLANVQKHAEAAHASLHARVQDGRLVVEVRDDGRGGADPTGGSGLAGLAGRVAALDGRLFVTSPDGGPTIVRAEIPCVS